MRRLRLVQVGLGFWGYDWAKEVLPTVDEIEVVASVDRDPAARQRVQATLGITPASCFASLDEALRAVDCDAVLASLPTAFHALVADEALRAGKHVLVEKPFTSTLEEAAALVATAREADRLLMVSQNYRFYPASLKAAELTASGRLGRLLQASIDFRRDSVREGYRYWDIPDPLLADMSIHHFDLIRMVTGDEPVEISCRTWNPPGSPFKADPAGAFTLSLGSGAAATYRGTWLSRGAATPWAGEWHMDFEEGAVAWTSRGSAPAGTGDDRLVIRSRKGKVEPQPLDQIRHYDRAGAIAAFARTILTGTAPPRLSTGADNQRSLALVSAAIESSRRQGAPVRIADVMPTNAA